jgi:asparagine synthase (glutamine-hydrolysing)
MCGIAGIVAPNCEGYKPAVDRMVAALNHRGPDGADAYFFTECALGHARLSIIDLKTGDQPMFSADRRVALTFNGEVYGYRELKKTLHDYPFATTSDTEVVIALYERDQTDMLPHLPGMFAFALWDDRTRTFFAGRDRFGEKPFYYAWGPKGEFVFASEIKALIASGLFQPKLNRKSVTHYLRHLYVHPHETIYSNVFVLPPAHQLILRDGRLTVERYWQLPKTKEVVSVEDAIDEFQQLFERAVENQLIADVPVGAFLSGGLDSSSVVAAASRKRARLRTLSFGFGDSINELPHAREIAQLYETDHIELEDRHEDIAQLMVEMARVYDEPFADSSNIPTYLISREARRFCKVVLTGDGGDELLGGYDFWYRPLRNMQSTNPKITRVAGLMRYAARISSRTAVLRGAELQQKAQGAEMWKQFSSITHAHRMQNTYFTDAELRELDAYVSSNGSQPNDADALLETVDTAMRMDLQDYMPGDILVKTDRASMAHGLELRAPFLDVDFASFCISLPERLKITDQQDKWILRQCYGRFWTEAIREKRKQGFGAPVEDWLKLPGVAELKRKVLDNPQHSLFSVIPFKASRTYAAQHNYQTWILLTLGLWLEQGGEKSL